MRHATLSGIRKIVPKAVVLAVIVGASTLASSGQPVQAENWMYNRSYYSHQLPPEVAANYPRPQSRSAYRVPELATTPGFALRGARRWNYVRLYSGNSYDTTILRSDTFNVVPP